MRGTPRPLPYAVATLAVSLAIGSLYIPGFGQGMAGLPLLAVLVAAWYGGLGPGLWAIVLVLSLAIGIIAGSGSPIELWRIASFGVFAVLGALFTFIVGSLHAAKRQIEGSEKWLTAVLASIGDAVIATDRRGSVVFMNPVAQNLTGWSREEASGRQLTRVFQLRATDSAGPVDNPVAHVLDKGATVSLGETMVLESRDGTEYPIAESAAPIKGPDGKISGAVLVFRDISEKKRAEDELREADRRKDEFLAMLGHELRNPLAAVNNAVAVLEISRDPAYTASARDMIARQVRHLTRLIDDLLDVARITQGKIRLQRNLVDAATILDHALETVRPFIHERRHELLVSIERGNLPLWADEARIEQTVVNLLNNAAKYTESGGLIQLWARRDGANVVITVGDNGIGIAPEKLPALFQLFAQGEQSIDRAQGGLGVGLTIVQRLVEMHGGTVQASSRGPGQGSEFTVRLPAAAHAEAGPAHGLASPGTVKACTRILVVDDNMDMALSMVHLLGLLGHEVAMAHDGPAALETARRFLPEFLLLDIGLPGMDGYELATAFRQEACLKDAVIIAISGYGQEEDRKRSHAAGFDHHLVKPVDFEVLVSLLGESAA